VLDAGTAGHGRRDGVRVSLSGDSWLVLGESFNRGWRAWCNGHPLGAPEPVDAYASGWRVGRGCRRVRFAFAPNRWATASYVISGVAVLALLALLLFSRGRRPATLEPSPLANSPTPRWPPRRALAAGVAVGLLGALLFALRTGPAIGALVALVLWRGVGARALSLAAGALLAVVVPALYFAVRPENHGGFNGKYGIDLIVAHWTALGAAVLLGLALWRTLSTATRPSGAQAVGQGAEAEPPTRP
jgi:arabinofuranan 3-O-arabinosyltransferase